MHVIGIFAAFYICEQIVVTNIAKMKCSWIKDCLLYFDFWHLKRNTHNHVYSRGIIFLLVPELFTPSHWLQVFTYICNKLKKKVFLYARLVGTYYGMVMASVWASVRPSVCLSVGLSANLVNMIQTEPFQLGLSNLVHILLMTRRRTLLIFKVRGQRSRSHARHCC